MDQERSHIQKMLIKLESQFKQYNDKLNSKERLIQESEQQINEGNLQIEELQRKIQEIEKEK